MTGTDGLADFLVARYDEAERQARELLRIAQDTLLALADPWMLGRPVPGWHSWPDVETLCAARLAGIAAKRAALALHRPELVEVVNADQDERSGWFCTVDDADWPCATVRHLAAEFAGHPDYKTQWKP